LDPTNKQSSDSTKAQLNLFKIETILQNFQKCFGAQGHLLSSVVFWLSPLLFLIDGGALNKKMLTAGKIKCVMMLTQCHLQCEWIRSHAHKKLLTASLQLTGLVKAQAQIVVLEWM